MYECNTHVIINDTEPKLSYNYFFLLKDETLYTLYKYNQM